MKPTIRQLVLLPLIGLGVAVAGCTSSGTRAAPSPAPTLSGTGQSESNGQTLQPTVPASQVGSADAETAPSGASPSAPAASTGAGGTRFTLGPGGSEVRYRARERLVGNLIQTDAVGATGSVMGSIVFDQGARIVKEQSKIVADLRSLRSNESRRDNWIQRNTLQTASFPTAELVAREAHGLPTPLPESGEVGFQLITDLTVHGVTRPVNWEVTARFAPQEVVGSARTAVKMMDFGMTPPRVGPVLSIEDTLTLEIDFRAAREDLGPVAAVVVESATVPSAIRCDPTRSDALGPFYVPGAPVRASVGRGYLVTGSVRAAGGCQTIPGASVEFWLANSIGTYDDDHRATVLAESRGEYRFESNVPPPYGGRPPHIHARATAPGFRTLVTQHYPQRGQTEGVFDLVLVDA